MRIGYSTFDGCRTLSLTTFCLSGQPAATPVGFAQDGLRLYVMLPANADEVGRIRANAQVEVAPCNQRGILIGAPVESMALVLTPDKSTPARRALHRKFGLSTRLHELSLILQRASCVYLEITPM